MIVLITHKIPDVCIELLEKNGIDFDIMDKNNLTKKDIIRVLSKKPYDAIVTLLTDEIDSFVIDSMGENMKIIANFAVGYNNIDVQYAKSKNIIVTNTPDVLTETVAEHTFSLILSVATRTVEADKFVRSGKFTGWQPELLLGLDLKDKTFGVIGAGRIGTRVCEIAHAFKMNIVYFDINENDIIKKLGGERKNTPEEVLRTSDFVSLHLPLTEDTYHFIDSIKLNMMKENAILVNTSRGPIIDEEALVHVLKEKKIFGAGLDVFENEPKLTRGLSKLNNVIITPHIASASISTRNNMSKIVGENIVSVLFGGEASTQV